MVLKRVPNLMAHCAVSFVGGPLRILIIFFGGVILLTSLELVRFGVRGTIELLESLRDF